jgi:hypothetical protein
VAVGTVKSRVNCARSKLASLLDITGEAELGPDRVTKAEMLGEVNFLSKPKWHTWAEYSVLAASLILAITVAASV